MKAHLIALLSFCCFSIVLTANRHPGDTLFPTEVVHAYFSLNGFPAKANHLCCAMDKEKFQSKTLGQSLSPRVMRTCRLIFQTSSQAVVSVWLRDAETSHDYYVYLTYEGCWKMRDIRTFQKVEETRKRLKELNALSKDQISKGLDTSSGRTLKFEQANLELQIAPDSSIKANLKAKQKDFNALVNYLKTKKYFDSGDSLLTAINADKKARALMDKCLIREVTRSKTNPHVFHFIIGGVGDNVVGFLYNDAPSPVKNTPDFTDQENYLHRSVPMPHENGYIIVDRIDLRWYLFKST
jgi:hypothetical protein